MPRRITQAGEKVTHFSGVRAGAERSQQATSVALLYPHTGVPLQDPAGSHLRTARLWRRGSGKHAQLGRHQRHHPLPRHPRCSWVGSALNIPGPRSAPAPHLPHIRLNRGNTQATPTPISPESEPGSGSEYKTAGRRRGKGSRCRSSRDAKCWYKTMLSARRRRKPTPEVDD